MTSRRDGQPEAGRPLESTYHPSTKDIGNEFVDVKDLILN